MQTKLLLIVFLMAGLLLSGAHTVRAQSGDGYDLTWNTLDSGGVVTSTGGEYQMAATIGQPDAAVAATTGDYNLSGGFWQPVVYLVYMPLVLR